MKLVSFFNYFGTLLILSQQNLKLMCLKQCPVVQFPCILGIFLLGFHPVFEPDKIQTVHFRSKIMWTLSILKWCICSWIFLSDSYPINTSFSSNNSIQLNLDRLYHYITIDCPRCTQRNYDIYSIYFIVEANKRNTRRFTDRVSTKSPFMGMFVIPSILPLLDDFFLSKDSILHKHAS